MRTEVRAFVVRNGEIENKRAFSCAPPTVVSICPSLLRSLSDQEPIDRSVACRLTGALRARLVRRIVAGAGEAVHLSVMLELQFEQLSVTVAFDHSRTNTLLPSDVSWQTSCGTRGSSSLRFVLSIVLLCQGKVGVGSHLEQQHRDTTVETLDSDR